MLIYDEYDVAVCEECEEEFKFEHSDYVTTVYHKENKLFEFCSTDCFKIWAHWEVYR